MAWIAPRRYLSQSEMENNAREVWAWWHSIGGTRESCAALLANMQQESTINPALPEQGRGTFVDIITWPYGYGLIQWTPCNQYYSLFSAQGLDIADPTDQLRWLNYECQAGRGYYYNNPSYTYRYWTWEEFKAASNPSDVADLTECFCWSRERPAYEYAALETRKQNAARWYTFLGGVVPSRLPIWLLFKIKERNDLNGLHRRERI